MKIKKTIETWFGSIEFSNNAKKPFIHIDISKTGFRGVRIDQEDILRSLMNGIEEILK